MLLTTRIQLKMFHRYGTGAHTNTSINVCKIRLLERNLEKKNNDDNNDDDDDKDNYN